MATDRMPLGVSRSGTLTATSQIIDLAGAPLPCSISVNSTAGSRLIEISTDGVTYFPPTLDTNVAGVIVASVTGRVLFGRVTGAIGDKWSVL